MPAEKRTPSRWTRAGVKRLIDEGPLQTPRYELVDGELFVTPSPSRAHQRAVAELYVALREYVRAQRLGRVYFSPSDAELEPETLVQPDLYVVPPEDDRRQDSEPVNRLLLAVEVLSPGSARADRGRKRLLYQRTVPEYWIVDLDARLVERWLADDARPDVVREVLTWTPQDASAPLEMNLATLFAEVWLERE